MRRVVGAESDRVAVLIPVLTWLHASSAAIQQWRRVQPPLYLECQEAEGARKHDGTARCRAKTWLALII